MTHDRLPAQDILIGQIQLRRCSVSGLNVQRLEFTLTNRCNAKCMYCQAEASPLKSELMDLSDTRKYLVEASSASNLESFMVFGGEPMLFPNLAISAFEKARELGIPRIEMLTNGIWGRNKARAKELAVKLRRSGLNDLGISVDAFHYQFIPLEYPRNVAVASVEAGIKEVTWNVAVLESQNSKNKYDRKTAEILGILAPVGIEAHVHQVLPVGRAVSKLRPYLKQESLEGPCAGDPILETELTDPECITMEPSGDVQICWHMTVGNAKEKPLSRIIREYDWRKNTIIKTLVEEGPMGLVESVERNGFHFRENRYLSRCHLCIEIRRTLTNPKQHRKTAANGSRDWRAKENRKGVGLR